MWEILALLVFSGFVLRWQKPNVLKCAMGLRHGMKPNDKLKSVGWTFVNIGKESKPTNPSKYLSKPMDFSIC
ncbi:hypothetical protein MARINOS108_20790 [Marinoscillum sp. 108]|nr:hypothetical protein MARINOS108_20790 [Marinoscillum sp. 108]